MFHLVAGAPAARTEKYAAKVALDSSWNRIGHLNERLSLEADCEHFPECFLELQYYDDAKSVAMKIDERSGD